MNPEQENQAPSSFAVGSFAGVRTAGGVLDRIVEAKARRLLDARTADSGVSVTAAGLSVGLPGTAFIDALSRPNQVNVIAEIKRQSPSKGIIRQDFDPLAIAASYAKNGAAALSVLTEEDFFGGSLEYLKKIRRELPEVPLLRKDFIFDLSQISESRDAGANALLLITAILDDYLLGSLIDSTEHAGLAPLVEVHNSEELERAAKAGARLIGVNNRDLRDFTVSLETSVQLATLAPQGRVLVSESGINTGQDIAYLTHAGYNAFLVGEHLMKADDPGAALSELIREAGGTMDAHGSENTNQEIHEVSL